MNVESLSVRDRADLVEIETHLRQRHARENFVRDLLDPDEYKQVEARFEAGEHITSLWMSLRSVTQAQAYAELGRRLLALPNDRALSLLRACGEEPPEPSPRAFSKPNWDKVARVLTLDGMICRQFKCGATRIFQILDAFQEQNWPRRIEGVLDDFETRHSAIGTLNKGCRFIRFRGADNGIIWERCTDQAKAAPKSRRTSPRKPNGGTKSPTRHKPR